MIGFIGSGVGFSTEIGLNSGIIRNRIAYKSKISDTVSSNVRNSSQRVRRRLQMISISIPLLKTTPPPPPPKPTPVFIRILDTLLSPFKSIFFGLAGILNLEAFINMIHRIVYRAFGGPAAGLFPSSVFDFLLLVIIALVERQAFRALHDLFSRASNIFIFQPQSNLSRQAIIQKLPPYRQSIFASLSDLTRLFVIALSSVGVLKLGVAILCEFGLSQVIPEVVGRKALILVCYLAVGRFIQRNLQGFIRKALIEKPYFREHEERLGSISQSLEFIVYAGLCFTAGEALGFNLRAFLALGGIGSLLIGLAAREAAENLVGGLSILLERPFIPGEVILADNGNILAAVESQGWTHTKLRRLDGARLTVPNVTLSRGMITNLSRLRGRQLKFDFDVRAQDAQRLSMILDKIRESIRADPRVDTNRRTRVYLDSIDERKLNVIVDVFLIDADYDRYLSTREQIILRVAQLVHANGAQFATSLSALQI
mmetsp:Transcript_8749/g.15784  ORF Transcript_8749/g.15784 Transcript_8749/m.15784 type:complete len:484 (-) Transcript_8749:150-1601(-)